MLTRRTRATAALAAVMALTVSGGAYGRAHSSRAEVVDRSSGTSGLQLSMSLAARAYPRNALVRVRVRLQNTTHQSATVMYNCIVPGFLTVNVLRRAGGRVYPPALVGSPANACPPVLSRPVRPGGHLEQSVYVILRAPVLQVVAEVMLAGAGFRRITYWRELRLYRMSAPRVDVAAGTAVHAHFTPPWPVQGLLRYMQWSECGTGEPTPSTSASQTWEVAATNSLSLARCAHQEWHAVAGWLNRPVGYVNYVSG